MSEPAIEQTFYRLNLNTPATPPSNVRREALKIAASTEQTLRGLGGITAATNGYEDDEYSDENIREWIEEDRLENQDPELVAWLKAQIGE